MYLGISSLNFSTKNGLSGRGPTRLMSPFKILNSCGSSSILVFRMSFPAGFVFLLNQSPTVPSLGFLAAAYLFWILTDRETSMGLTSLIPAVIAVLLYVFCASVLAPELSPVFFQWRAPLCQKVNEIIKISDSPASDPVAVIGTGFSYETGETTQRLNNTAPAYQHQAMFRLTSDFHPKKTIFLRGFIGGSYSNAPSKKY